MESFVSGFLERSRRATISAKLPIVPRSKSLPEARRYGSRSWSRSRARERRKHASDSVESAEWMGESGRSPSVVGIEAAAIEATSGAEACAAVRAGGLRLECVERLSALTANPVVADGRRGFARRARKFQAARQLGHTQQDPRVLQPAPAIQQAENRQSPEPS